MTLYGCRFVFWILSDVAQYNLGNKGRGDNEKVMTAEWTKRSHPKESTTFNFLVPTSWLFSCPTVCSNLHAWALKEINKCLAKVIVCGGWRGGGVLEKNPFCEGGMLIFWSGITH